LVALRTQKRLWGKSSLEELEGDVEEFGQNAEAKGKE
jgi:hypothetical protein